MPSSVTGPWSSVGSGSLPRRGGSWSCCWWLSVTLGQEDAPGVTAERVVGPETQVKRKLTPSPASS